MAPPLSAARPVRLVNYLAYGANDALGAGSMAIVSGWLLLFYTRFCGLSAGQAALIFAAARVIDAVLSPLIGHLSDHMGAHGLGRRFGRRRVFILAAIPLLPSFALMWLPGQGFWYYLVSYVAFEMVYALEIIPYETLAAEMAEDFVTKARMAGSRIIFGQLSAILAGFAPMWLIGWLGRDNAATFFWMAAVFTGLFMVVAGLLYAFSWERARGAAPMPPGRSAGQVLAGMVADLRATLQVRAFRLHLGMYLGGYISQDIFNATFTFFVLFALGGSTAAASGLLGSMYIVQLFAVGLAMQLVLRMGPAPAYRWAALAFAAGVVVLLGGWQAHWRVGAEGLWLAIGLAGLGRGMLNYIPWATYNYMADVDEIITGQRREGSFAGVMTFVRKATQALAVALVGMGLEAGGIRPAAAAQGPAAMAVLAAVLGAGTLAMLAGGVAVSRRFRLNGATHGVLMHEIRHLRGGATGPSSAAAQAVVEDLTGCAYARLWGRAPR